MISMGGFSFVACGGSKPPAAAAPVTMPSAAPSSATSATPTVPASGVSVSAPSDASPSPAASTTVVAEAPTAAEPQERRHVVDELTGPNVAYTIEYSESGPKEAAEKACASKADDPRARAACMEKERGRFLADVLVFKKDPKGPYWVIYRRKGDTLAEVSKSAIEFKNETGNGVTVQIKSDKGWRPLFAGSKTVAISAPPGSNIELEDPTLGKLVYEAKIGLVNQ